MRILCVEDDPEIRAIRCAFLEELQYRAVPASIRQAESLLMAYEEFDLVLVSRATDDDLKRLTCAADGAKILQFAEHITPADLLCAVVEGVQHQQYANGLAKMN